MTSLEELGRVESADILVIGGGIGGLAAATAAKEKNPDADVLVVEKASTGWAGQANKGAGIWWYLAPEDDVDALRASSTSSTSATTSRTRTCSPTSAARASGCSSAWAAGRASSSAATDEIHPQALQAVPALEPHRHGPRLHARAQAHGTQARRALHRQDVAHRPAHRRRARRRRRRLQPARRHADRRQGAGGDHRHRRPELPHHGHVELPARRWPGHGLARRRADAQRRVGPLRPARRQARQGAAHRRRGRALQRLAREALADLPRRVRGRRLRHDQRGLVPADGGRQRAADDVPPRELDARQHHRGRGGRHRVGPARGREVLDHADQPGARGRRAGRLSRGLPGRARRALPHPRRPPDGDVGARPLRLRQRLLQRLRPAGRRAGLARAHARGGPLRRHLHGHPRRRVGGVRRGRRRRARRRAGRGARARRARSARAATACPPWTSSAASRTP